jgi:hypothetical protein
MEFANINKKLVNYFAAQTNVKNDLKDAVAKTLLLL